MKITVEISDALLEAARQAARRDGTTLRALIEHGLRLALNVQTPAPAFRLRDASVPGCGLQPGIEDLSWDELRGVACGDHAHSR